jgi:hypothetical protein
MTRNLLAHTAGGWEVHCQVITEDLLAVSFCDKGETAKESEREDLPFYTILTPAMTVNLLP